MVAPARERGLKFVRDCYEDMKRLVAPARERGLKYQDYNLPKGQKLVAPARERGLKFQQMFGQQAKAGSLPQGSVD